LALSQAELRERLTLPDLSEHPHRFRRSDRFVFPTGRTRHRNVARPQSLGYWLVVVFGERKNLTQLVQLLDSEHAANSAKHSNEART
jgi:hypothetical protein